MTNEEISNLLNSHIKNMNNDKEIIKNKIKIFFDINVKKENLFNIITEEFQDEISKFKEKYLHTLPIDLRGTLYEVNAISNSSVLYLDLCRYPQTLVDSLSKNI